MALQRAVPARNLPTTEANLGDGLTDVAAWLDAGTALAIGSDSHVTRDWREELRVTA